MTKRLLQINVTSNWGSTGKIAEQIGILALNQGWESYVAFGRYSNPSKVINLRIGNQFNVYEHYLESIFLDKEGLASRKSTISFINKIEEIHPSLIHLHNIHDHYLNYRLLFSYLAKKSIPVVWTQHDQWAFTGHCSYIPEGCQKWKEECILCPLKKVYSLDRCNENFKLKRKLITNLPLLTIVPVSDWLAGEIRKSFIKDIPIKVIHNGIDLNAFFPSPIDVHARYGIENKKIILGVASVWDARKGLKDFFDLVDLLSSDEFAIIIVGKVPKAIKKKQPTPRQHKMIIFIDRTQNLNELRDLYSSAFVYVNPTYQDNFPTTNIEALACGTPVITYRTGGSPEAVDEKTGAVIEQGDIFRLSELINEMVKNPLNRNDCRRRADMFFNKETCFQEYMTLYNQILSLY